MYDNDDVARDIGDGVPALLQGSVGGQIASFRANGNIIFGSIGAMDTAEAFGKVLDGIASKKASAKMSSSGVPKELFLNRAQAYLDFNVSDFSRENPKSNQEWARIHKAFVAETYES